MDAPLQAQAYAQAICPAAIRPLDGNAAKFVPDLGDHNRRSQSAGPATSPSSWPIVTQQPGASVRRAAAMQIAERPGDSPTHCTSAVAFRRQVALRRSSRLALLAAVVRQQAASPSHDPGALAERRSSTCSAGAVRCRARSALARNVGRS